MVRCPITTNHSVYDNVKLHLCSLLVHRNCGLFLTIWQHTIDHFGWWTSSKIMVISSEIVEDHPEIYTPTHTYISTCSSAIGSRFRSIPTGHLLRAIPWEWSREFQFNVPAQSSPINRAIRHHRKWPVPRLPINCSSKVGPTLHLVCILAMPCRIACSH